MWLAMLLMILEIAVADCAYLVVRDMISSGLLSCAQSKHRPLYEMPYSLTWR